MTRDSDLLDKMYDKQDKILEDIGEIKVTLAAQHESLKAHMKRTALNEENIKMLREEVKPLSKHMNMINGIAKFITLLGVIVGIVAGVSKILS